MVRFQSELLSTSKMKFSCAVCVLVVLAAVCTGESDTYKHTPSHKSRSPRELA